MEVKVRPQAATSYSAFTLVASTVAPLFLCENVLSARAYYIWLMHFASMHFSFCNKN